jgi:hypothetical protein
MTKTKTDTPFVIRSGLKGQPDARAVYLRTDTTVQLGRLDRRGHRWFATNMRGSIIGWSDHRDDAARILYDRWEESK